MQKTSIPVLIKKYFILTASWISLVACPLPFQGDCYYPSSSKDELRVLGATVTQCVSSNSESPSIRFLPPDEHSSIGFIQTVELDMLFFAVDQLEEFNFPYVDNEVGSFSLTDQFLFFYSEEVNGSNQIIDPASDQWDPTGPANQYSSAVGLMSDPRELVIKGNYFVDIGISGLSAPIDATHIELWFRKDTNSEYQLVNRVALSSLEYWNRHIQPVILNNQ